MRIHWIITACIALSGCMTNAPPPPKIAAAQPVPLPPAQLSKEEIRAIEAGARSGMKDPDSARFGRMIAGLDGQDVFVCLMINAKNSYGGYTGEKPFMGLLFRQKKPLTFALVPTDDRFPEFRDQAVLKVCGDKGLTFS